MFDPTGPGKDLAVLLLVQADHPAPTVEDDEPVAGGAQIQGADEFAHVLSPCSKWFPSLPRAQILAKRSILKIDLSLLLRWNPSPALSPFEGFEAVFPSAAIVQY